MFAGRCKRQGRPLRTARTPRSVPARLDPLSEKPDDTDDGADDHARLHPESAIKVAARLSTQLVSLFVEGLVELGAHPRLTAPARSPYGNLSLA